MSGTPWIRFYPSDWLGGTRGFSAAESGIYISLICLMYESPEGKIQNHTARLARYCGASGASFKRTLSMLIECGKIVDRSGYLSNNRVVEERLYSQQKTNVARDKAIRRWNGKINKNNGSLDATAIQQQCTGDASARVSEPEPEPEPNKKEIPKTESLVNGAAVYTPAKSKSYPIQKAFDNWNIIADEYGLPIATTLTEERKRKIRARLVEHDLPGWNKALEMIELSQFLQGKGDKGWRPSLEFFLQPSSFNKVLDGAYSDERDF